MVNTVIAALLAGVPFLFGHHKGIAAGIIAGALVGAVNFLVLQFSVRSMVAVPLAPASGKHLARHVFGHMALFLLKFVVLAGVLFVLVKILSLSLVGIFIGLALSMALYILQVMKQQRNYVHST